jgi:NADH:ubiquinone oxidoreductase subunit 5 (subunit L)/multisubunit Na+/H+ antiporter MnhA subunit
MCAGGVMGSMGDCQDIRFMGSLFVYMPSSSSSLIVSNIVLCGMPFWLDFIQFHHASRMVKL